MSEEQLYWQKEDYEPTFEDICTEWENQNAEYFQEWHYEVLDIIEDNKDEWEWPYNLFVKACAEAGGYNKFAEQLISFIEEGDAFYDEMIEYLTGDLEAMTVVIENSRWYKSDTIANIYEGLRNRETLRQSAKEAAGNAAALQKQVEELQSDLEFYKNECSIKDEEINRLQEILDENGIAY